MKKCVVLFFCLVCFSGALSAQWGISLGYKQINASDWDNIFANYNISNDADLSPLHEGTAFGIDRWFRLKNYRVEFTPQLMYSRYARQRNNDQKPNLDINANLYSFHFNTSFYALDLEGDCNCPTFSKDGNFFSKGFFFQVSPELFIMYNQLKIDNQKHTANDFGFGIGIGAGLDIGLSDFITITPFIRYSYYPNVEWENLNEILSVDALPPPGSAENNTTDMVQLFFGIRLGFRFDELNKYGYR